MSTTAISTFQRAEQFTIGSVKPVSVKNSLNCVSNKNPVFKLWHKFLCILSRKGFITKNRLVKAMHDADLPTLKKIQKLFDKAQKIADEDSKAADPAKAAEKKAALKFLAKSKNNEVFLNLLKEELLLKFAGNDPAVLSLCKSLPEPAKKVIFELSKEGITSTYLATKYRKGDEPAAETLKTLFAVEGFEKTFDADLKGLFAPKADTIPPMEDLLKSLNGGLIGIINNGCKLQKDPSKDFVKAVTFKIGDQTDKPNLETLLVAPKPTNQNETAEIFKKALAEKSSHIVTLDYPEYLSMKIHVEQKLGDSSISLKLICQELIALDTKDPTAHAIKKNFLITDTSVKDKPVERTIAVLVYPNWGKDGTFKINEMTGFLASDQGIAAAQPDEFKKNPLFIGSDGFARLATYITLRKVEPSATGNLPIVETFRNISKFLGASALPTMPEEVAAIFARFKQNPTPEELALLKPLKTEFTQEELAKHLLGPDATPVQIADRVRELDYLKLNPSLLSLAAFQYTSLLEKDKISSQSIHSFIDEKSKAYGIPQGTFKEFPEVVDEIIVEYKKACAEKRAALAKEIFKDATAEALKAKEEILSQIISDPVVLEEFKNPVYHAGIKELIEKKTSWNEFNLLVDEFKSNIYNGLSDAFKKKDADGAFTTLNGPFDLSLILKDHEAFKELLSALLAAKAAKV